MGFLRVLAFLFGVAFLAAGILGYMPAYTPDGQLFGYLHVDNVHNIVHIITGVFALLAAASSGAYSRLYFQVFGILYGIATVCGFVFGGDLYIMHVNMADNVFHLIIAVVALYFGFLFGASSRED